MMIDRINPPTIFAHPNFSRMIVVDNPGRLVWISGQTAQSADLTCVAPGDFQAQYIDIMTKLALQLEAVDATWADVVFRRTYTTDIRQLRAAMALPSTPDYFGATLPCSTLIGVTELSDPGFVVEIEILLAISR